MTTSASGSSRSSSPTVQRPDRLIEHVAGQLSVHKRPREVRLVDELPRNAMGKVQKTRLIDLVVLTTEVGYARSGCCLGASRSPGCCCCVSGWSRTGMASAPIDLRTPPAKSGCLHQPSVELAGAAHRVSMRVAGCRDRHHPHPAVWWSQRSSTSATPVFSVFGAVTSSVSLPLLQHERLGSW